MQRRAVRRPVRRACGSTDQSTGAEAADLISRIRNELAEAGLAHSEVLLSYLKILLVLATRLKLRQGGGEACSPASSAGARAASSPLIEANYRTPHRPADYAELLHVTPKTLGRLVRKWLGKTPTDLIRERILKHRWQLLHTLRPVKEIAREVGFDDELYFSRFFKRATGYSPLFFREFETAIRGGANLSMPSSPPSIPEAAIRN